MITNYFTLHALVAEWHEHVAAAEAGDVFSQQPGELTIAYASRSEEGMIRLSIRAPFRYVFRVEGYSKARRNVASLFTEAVGHRITAVRIAERDRILFLDLEGGLVIQVALFGPRANVFLVGPDGKIVEAFQSGSELAGGEAPVPRPAPVVDTLDGLMQRWRHDRPSIAAAVASAFPLFDRTLARETASRAGIDADRSPDLAEGELARLLEASREIESQLAAPRARIYWRDGRAETFSLIELTHLRDMEEEPFESVDDAVRTFIRRTLVQRRFDELYEPLESALKNAARHHHAAVERMLAELSTESRAERYEKWGHLLMAAIARVPSAVEQAEVDDLYEGGTTTIPLDPALSAVENAQRYYDRARRTRRSREEAEIRLMDTEKMAREAESLLAEMRKANSIRDVEAFRKDRSAALARLLPDGSSQADRLPFRRITLPEGYEVWIGRNARQNDDLTFHHAQKHDLWMHARGVAGSHAVLRLPNKSARPSRHIIEMAASIAAHFSKARGSSLVPVIVTERKYVRKPRGAAPGAVVVGRENVVLAEPGLPKSS